MATFPITSPDLLTGGATTKVVLGAAGGLQVIHQSTSTSLSTIITELDFAAEPGEVYVMEGMLLLSTTTAATTAQARLQQRWNSPTAHADGLVTIQFGVVGTKTNPTEADGSSVDVVSTVKASEVMQAWTEVIQVGLPAMPTGNEPPSTAGATLVPVHGLVDARAALDVITVETGIHSSVATFPGARLHMGSWLKYTKVNL